jgi:hypothetical protein
VIIIKTTIIIMDNIHRHIFHLKLDISETGFSLRLEMEPT